MAATASDLTSAADISEGSENWAEADRAVFAQSALLRRLPSANGRKGSLALLSSCLSSASSTPLLPASSPLRRPATAAAATHSRVHQALRYNANEFEFSSKESTVEGLCYSSRFPIKEFAAKGGNQHPNHLASSPSIRQRKHNSFLEDTEQQDSTADEQSHVPSEDLSTMDVQARKKEMRRQLLEQRARAAANPTIVTSGMEDVAKTAPVIDGATSILRKRRCAKTFEDMIAVRLKLQDVAVTPTTSAKAGLDRRKALSGADEGALRTQSVGLDNGMEKLLEHGIIPSVLALSSSSDGATQAHCCRALYYLSRVRAARKSMITNGVVASLKQLSRITAPAPRQDLAATLCHLSEEDGVVEVLFFEGIDRCLVRLMASPSRETTRICSATVFNLSADARHIKHFSEGFTQLLIASTKANAGSGGSGLLSPTTSTELTSSGAYLIKAVYNASLLPTFHGALLGDNVPPFLAAQLPTVPAVIQGWALRAFVSLCEVRANRLNLLSPSFLQLLEPMLLSPNEEIQEITLLVLLLLSTDEGSRIKICNWLPIGSLVQTGSQHVDSAVVAPTTSVGEVSNTGTQRQSTQPGSCPAKDDHLVYLHSCILRNLCGSVLTHHELIHEGAVPVLLKMSRMPDPAVKANAIVAFCSLIASSTEEVAAHVPELSERLLALTRTSSIPDCVFAIGALYNICCSDDCIPLVSDSKALLDRLVQLAAAPPHKKVAELVAAIVYRLAEFAGCVSRLLQRGFVSELVRLIRQYPSCRAFALNALFLLAKNGGEDFPHGGDEMAQLVLALLSDGSEFETAVDAAIHANAPAQLSKRHINLDVVHGDPATLRSGVTLLAHLAHHPKNRGALVRNGAVFRFLKRLNRLQPQSKSKHNVSGVVNEEDDEDEGVSPQDNEDDTILTNCAFVYYSLTATQEGCEFLVKERGVEDLIHLARTRTSPTESQVKINSESGGTYTVKELCTLALCRLSSFVGLEARLIEQGAIQGIMVLALVATDNVTIKALCIKILANCLVNVTPTCLQSLVGHGIIWALVSLCTVEYPETSYACVVSLCNLSAQPSKVPKFLEAGAPRALIHLLQRSGGADADEDAAIVLATVKTIANLVASEKLCQVFLNEGLEKHLSMHFSSPDSSDELRQLAAMVLLRVTSTNDALISAERLKVSVLLWMEQIISMKDQDLVRNCMLTVHDLTSNTSLDMADLDVLHVLRILVQVLQRHHAHNTQIVTLCLSVLYNLSCQLSVLAMIMQSEIMPFLRQLVPSLETVQRRNSNRSGSTVLLTPGAPTPRTFTSHVNIKLCCLVLHNLSCCRSDVQSQDVLSSLVTCHAVATLHDIYFGPFDGLKEIAVAAICNITVGKVNSTRVLEDHAGTVLLHFIRSDHFAAKHYLLMSAALRKLTNAPGNQTRLLAARTASAMVFMLTLPEMDNDASTNLLVALHLLSNCKTHLPRLLSDGVLPCVVQIADKLTATPEMRSCCFEITSNLCSVDFQNYVKDHPDINVIATLTKMSENHSHHPHPSHHQHQVQSPHPSTATSLASYCARGEGGLLPLPELHTTLMKSPVSTMGAAKKNLELKATYTVPARKWSPQAQPKPKDPPPLVCEEIPLTDNGQCVSPVVKQRIGCFTVLPKEALVRDEGNDAVVSAPVSGLPTRSTQARHSSELDVGSAGMLNTLRALNFRSRADSVVAGSGRKLQHAKGGRHLSERHNLIAERGTASFTTKS
ncbi:hypothetical protein BBJ28_00002284 [Nothophytophthora sp. Chile5]|nr:hypothetical protein BBJ28_00002284 [Nothophytophthora sp. Chile5]